MTRRDLMLAVMATAGEGAFFTPVQVQKIFFLIDREAAEVVGGPHFHFRPYDYGPFDAAVYDELEIMAQAGLVEISQGRYRQYALTQTGYVRGPAILDDMAADTQKFIREVVTWVRSLRFDQLVSAIYKAYPEMKENSVFQQ